MKYITTFINELAYLTFEMAPYLVLGFIFAGILHIYVKKEMVQKYLGKKNFRSVIYSVLLGIPLPLCSCGVIPTGISFHKEGASKGATISFLISTPQTGVDSIMATYSLLGLPFAILRPIVALVTGVFGGVFTNMTEEKEETSSTDNKDECGDSCCSTDKKEYKNKYAEMIRYAFVELIQDISKWLIIGLIIAALISIILPDDFFSMYIGNPVLSMLLILVASVPLYVCATGSIPIAAVLLMKGLSPGAALVFLMAGPATNAATITVISKTLGKKSMFSYLASIIGGALFFGFIVDYFFPESLFTSSIKMMHHDHSSHLIPEWLKYVSTAILVVAIINGFRLKYFPKKNSAITYSDRLSLNVHGMKCNHCKENVEKHLSKIDGIKNVIVDLANKKVTIEGENLDSGKIIDTVLSLGYEVK